MEKNSNPQRDI